MGSQMSAHALLETPSKFAIVLNLLGIDKKDIAVRIDGFKRELCILAKRDSSSCKKAFYWSFGIPAELALEQITTRYRGGVLEIAIPKQILKGVGR